MILPRYVPYVPGTEKHRFQIEMECIRKKAKRVLIVTAPTGAGKTYAISALTKNARGPFSGKVLITAPTNALATQICRDLLDMPDPPYVTTWAASEFESNGPRRIIEMINQAQTNDVIVSNPDLIHLLTTNFYARTNVPQKHRTFEDVLARLEIHVFDEYHAYDERMMASVIAYMLKARQMPACRHHRYIFMSATPRAELPSILSRFGFEYEVIEEGETECNETGSRQVKGALVVEFTDSPVEEILDSELPSPGQGFPRTLVVFDSFVGQERALWHLISRGYRRDADGDIVAMTGRDTKSEEGQEEWSRAPIIMATSKADLGLNIDGLDKLIMEPGWATSQFWQRFGRAGRGRDANVIISIPPGLGQLLSGPMNDGIKGIDDIITHITKRQDFSDNRVQDYVGFYLAATEHLTRKAGLLDTIREISLPSRAAQARGLMRKIQFMPENEYSGSREARARALTERVIRSVCWLRGQALEVDCTYSRPDRPMTLKENILFILSQTENQYRDGIYVVTGFKDKPIDAMVSYKGLASNVSITVPHGKPNWTTWSKFVDKLVNSMKTLTNDGEAGEWLKAFEEVLRRLTPDTLPPLEVAADDQFI